MSTPPSMAVAVPFTWTPDATYDLRLAFASGASPANVLLVAGDYRMNLAPSSGSVQDFLRHVETRINAKLATLGRAETVTVSISTQGIVSIAMSGGVATWTFTSTLRDTLGMGSTTFTSLATAAGTYPPQGLYLFCGGDSDGWQRKEPIAGAMTQAGASYGVRSNIVTWEDTVRMEFIPSDPDARTQIGESWSPWENNDATLPWPCTRLVETALSKRCAFARYWQDTRASTSERYDLVTIPPDTLKTPDVKQQFPSLTTFRTWPLRMVRTATETRA